MHSITDYLTQIQELTNRNLEILQALNDSFYTKKEHLTVSIGDSQYVIPSFISIENKLNALQDDFENLVNAPKTGSANFIFDGNTQKINLAGFTNTPERLELSTVSNFGVENNDIFKDFLTPNPYINISLSTLPNNIKTVNVKKIIPINDELRTLLGINSLGDDASKTVEYAEVVKKLYNYKEDVDYVEYDKLYRLPIRDNTGYGRYTIKEIVSQGVDENFYDTYTLTLNENLTYTINSGTIERNIQVGDHLVTHDDKVKMEITGVYFDSKTIDVTIESGAYADLVEYVSSNGSDLSVLKYFTSVDFDNYKNINIPLEEDRYFCVFVSPVNDDLNIQSDWGVGLMIDVNNLSSNIDGTLYKFNDYYKYFINNVGDVLYSLTSMVNNNLNKYSESEFNSFVSVKPELENDTLTVTQINNHLNNSETVSKIRSLYNQKEKYLTELEEVQNNIDNINTLLNEISFEDTTNNRTIYTSQLNTYNARKIELNQAVKNIIQEISESANNSVLPIDNAKYHIRGYFDLNKFKEDNPSSVDIIKIIVEYRYKNQDKSTGNAITINNDFVYSDWNIMYSDYRNKIADYSNNNYTYTLQEDNGDINEPSFNQIDIPISQGETVDIRLKVVYDLGYPFVVVTSDWSDILNVEFPSEYNEDITILDIIEENNNEIKKNQFNNILEENGIFNHVDDKLTDQDITYYHQPEHIASGFYTSERRVIPLKDELLSIYNDLVDLKDEVYGTASNRLTVSVTYNDIDTTINSYTSNILVVDGYSNVSADDKDENGYAVANLMVNLQNNSDRSLKLYSLFYGKMDTLISANSNNYLHVDNYLYPLIEVAQGVESSTASGSNDIAYPEGATDPSDISSYYNNQKQNQIIYFRQNSAYNNGIKYYDKVPPFYAKNDKLFGTDDPRTSVGDYKVSQLIGIETIGLTSSITLGAVLYPSIDSWNDICITDNSKYVTLNPNESISIPLIFKYNVPTEGTSIQKTVSFDVRTSLYNDPINYELTVKAFTSNSISKKVKDVDKKKLTKYRPTVIK